MNIKGLIKQRGFNSSQVAEQLGITKGAFSLMVNNPNPTMETLRKIARVIDCNMVDFFADEIPSENPAIICPHCGKIIKIKVCTD